MTIVDAREILKTIAPAQTLKEEAKLRRIYEAIQTAIKTFDALETIRAEVEEIAAAARMREDTEVTFTAGIIAGVIDREIAKVEGRG